MPRKEKIMSLEGFIKKITDFFSEDKEEDDKEEKEEKKQPPVQKGKLTGENVF